MPRELQDHDVRARRDVAHPVRLEVGRQPRVEHVERHRLQAHERRDPPREPVAPDRTAGDRGDGGGRGIRRAGCASGCQTPRDDRKGEQDAGGRECPAPAERGSADGEVRDRHDEPGEDRADSAHRRGEHRRHPGGPVGEVALDDRGQQHIADRGAGADECRADPHVRLHAGKRPPHGAERQERSAQSTARNRPNRIASPWASGETRAKPTRGTDASRPSVAGAASRSAPICSSSGPTPVKVARRFAATSRIATARRTASRPLTPRAAAPGPRDTRSEGCRRIGAGAAGQRRPKRSAGRPCAPFPRRCAAARRRRRRSSAACSGRSAVQVRAHRLGVDGCRAVATVTTAQGTSPQRSSGTPMTATPVTPVDVVDQVLDLGGVDVLAAGDDHVLQPVGDVEVAVGVEVAEVARAEPAVGGERGGRRIGQVRGSRGRRSAR